MSQTLFAFARIEPKREHFADARDAIAAIIDVTRAEAGCRQFVLHDDESHGLLYLYEEWRDEVALKAHHAEPYTSAVFAKYQDWLAVPVRLETMLKIK